MSGLIENVIPAIKQNRGYFSALPFTTSGTVTLNGNVIGYATSAQSNQGPTVAATYAVNQTIFVNDNLTGTYQVVAATATFGTAGGTSCAVNVEVATGTQAIASGTNQMSSALVLTGAINTPVSGTITTQTTITAGARVNLIFSGTVTGLANFSINVILKKIS
jgi:hypothetical protein